MALTVFKQGELIRKKGDSFDAIFLVAKGVIEAEFLGKKFGYKQGDTAGLCGAFSGIYDMNYTAHNEVTAYKFACKDIAAAAEFLRGNADLMSKVVASMCNKASELLTLRASMADEASMAYENLKFAYPEYQRLCGLYSYASKKLDAYDSLQEAGDADEVEKWLPNYYLQCATLSSNAKNELFGNTEIALGFLHMGVKHLNEIMLSARAYDEYLSEISKIYLDKSGHDILAMISELHEASINIRGADESIGPLKASIAELLKKLTHIQRGLLKERLAIDEEELLKKRDETGDALEEALSADGVKQNLKDALYTILEYAEIGEEAQNKFVRDVHDFTQLRDRTSTDDDVFRLRRELTKDFYSIYTPVFIKSLEDPKVPTVIKMFLNFGFVDAELAGLDNANFLYSIADSYKGRPEAGIYTITEWLTAIYKGEKQPSQGDLDTDYASHVKESVQAMRLTPDAAEKETKRMLNDTMEKLRFELEAVFPVGNKITFGRVTSYVPIFADHNVQRNADRALVTPERLQEYLDNVLALDFSAFYREVQYSNPDVGINTMQINKTHMPTFILFPNAGSRGVMWQEIEGRNRQSSCRMFLPAFYLEDLGQAVMRLVGEFRWEMVKRIQGSRWSDATSPSLTSEYFTYLQFYRSNRDLSVDAKSSVKTELMRARNVFRAVFVSNYIDYLTYEAKGSQRLNKVARRILFQYCPFPLEKREKLLTTSPQYVEALKPFNLALRQNQQKMANTMQRITQQGQIVPQELKDELDFIQK